MFGTDDNIVDVPRNVTIISRQQLNDINISRVLDFSKLTSSSYTFDSGWGFSTNALLTGPIKNNYAGTLVIPSQYEIDGSIWYHYKKWEYRLNVGKLTNQKNWALPNSVYGNASILAMAGTTFPLNVKYHF